MECTRMARAAAQIIADIRAFLPAGGAWRPLDDLLAELWATGEASQFVPDLLAVLERFPEDDGAGVLWSIVHGLEDVPNYEPDLVRSLQRRPSELAVTMAGRLMNSGVFEVAGVSLIELLRLISTADDASQGVRDRAAKWVARHAARPPT
jgi:hypothetical protein